MGFVKSTRGSNMEAFVGYLLSLFLFFLEYYLVRVGRMTNRIIYVILGIAMGFGGAMAIILVNLPAIERGLEALEYYLENNFLIQVITILMIFILNLVIFLDLADEEFAQSFFTNPDMRYVFVIIFAISGTMVGWVALTQLIAIESVSVVSLVIAVFTVTLVFRLATK